VKANASKAPARTAAKTATASPKKSAAAKPATALDAAVKAVASKKVTAKAPSKAKPAPATGPKDAKPPVAGKSPAPAPGKTTAKATLVAPSAKAKGKSAPAKATPTKAGAGPNAAAAAAKPSSPASSKTAKAATAAKTAPAGKTLPGSARPGIGVGSKAAPPKRVSEGYVKDERFLASQRAALERERVTYLEQAANLKAEAESLVEEMEPGDIQFDDESGEGGTVTVDRERDLALSAQALAAVEEIDHALAKMNNGTYGICENCGRLIPKARLEALPYARLCIDCKSGGLSRR